MSLAGLSQSIKRWTRITRFALHLARGMFIAAFLFPLQSAQRRKREVEHWSLRLLDVLNIRLFLHGKPPLYGSRPLMIVANHVSWLDIFAINSIVPSRFVAKAEVRAWPLVGWLCARAGTLFIERARRHDTARINDRVCEALRRGQVFAVFPEGTTTDGSTVLKFHASLLEPALEAEAVVQPVALRYERSDGTLCTEAAYSDGKSVWDALMGITSQHEIIARVCFVEPIAVGARHRRDIAREAREAILLTLYPQAPGSRTDTRDDLPAAVH
jgi:1-acyl-sn-glycerol-3-phosphate acyltransferase